MPDQPSPDNDTPVVDVIDDDSTLKNSPVTTGQEKPTDDVSAGHDNDVSSEEPSDGENDPVAALRRESAKYRTRARDAESERDQLQARVEAMQRRAATQAAQGPGGLASGDDLWRDEQVQLADLVDEDGAVDRHKLAEAVTGVIQRQPHWAHRPEPPPGRPVERLKPGTADPTQPAEPIGWDTLLRKATQQ